MSSDWRSRDALADPERAAVRHDGDGPVVWRDGERTPEEGESERRYPTYGFVASEGDREALRFADVDGVDEVESFLNGVDFDSETIHYVQSEVRECYRRELCHVAWSSDRVQTQFAWHLRDAGEACEADAHVIVAWFVKIPEALDPDDITQYGTGGSGDCHLPDRVGNRSRGNATGADGSEAGTEGVAAEAAGGSSAGTGGEE